MPTIPAARSASRSSRKLAAAVHLDEQAAELAQRVVARLAQRAALAAQQPGVRAARGDAFRRVGAPAEARRHAAQSTHGGGALELQDDETLFGHLAHGPGGAFAGVAGGLDAAVGHLVGAERRRLVDDHAAELEPAGRVEGGPEVAA